MADDCLRSSLRRGVPPLFVVLRPLYSDPRRLAVIEELVLGYVDSLKDTGRFSRGAGRCARPCVICDACGAPGH